MEESAEEILARLERYAASLHRRPLPPAVHSGAVPIAVDMPAASRPVPAVDTLIPTRTEPARQRPEVVAVDLPVVLAASSCVLAILAFAWLDHAVAIAIVAALTLAGVIGIVRRVSFAGSWTFGLVVAGLLIRFS